MKYLKTFEDINFGKPKIGDYVIVYTDSNNFREFINYNIGQIIGDFFIEDDNRLLKIKYFNIPEDKKYLFNNDITSYSDNHVKYFSPNKEELEDVLVANKYNL